MAVDHGMASDLSGAAASPPAPPAKAGRVAAGGSIQQLQEKSREFSKDRPRRAAPSQKAQKPTEKVSQKSFWQGQKVLDTSGEAMA